MAIVDLPSFGTEDVNITTLYVGNIERHWTEDDLRNVFKKYGDLSRVKLVPNKSCAFVTYGTRKVCALPSFVMTQLAICYDW